MGNGIVLVDANSIGFAAQGGTKLSVGGQEVQAIFGVVRTVRNLLVEHGGMKIALLWDGVSWRKRAMEELEAGPYKGKRDLNPKAAQLRESYRAQRPIISRAMRALGVIQVAGAELEADDLAGVMATQGTKTGQPIKMISGDKDWLQLVSPSCYWHDPIRNLTITANTFHDATGYATPHAFLQGKALQGDVGDNIPGVGGIGEKGAAELLGTYGSVENFWAEAPTTKKLGKKMREFAELPERQETFKRNMMLMDLTVPPPAWVNRSYKIVSASQDLSMFRGICEDYQFNSILRDFDNFVQPFGRIAA